MGEPIADLLRALATRLLDSGAKPHLVAELRMLAERAELLEAEQSRLAVAAYLREHPEASGKETV